MNLAPVFRQRFFDANGAPLSGGMLYSYAAGTTTPQATYSDLSGTSNENPVVLDSNGYADIWLDPALSYKIILQDSGGNPLWSVDHVANSIGLAAWNANSVYSKGAIVTDASGFGLLYVSLIDNNQGNALTSVSSWRVFGGHVRTLTADTVLAITDDLIRSDSTAGNRTLTLPPCSSTPIGKSITVKDVGTGGHSTTIKGSGTDTLDGNNTFFEALAEYAGVSFINNGSSWDSRGSVSPKSITAAKIADGTITTTQISGTAGITAAQLGTGAAVGNIAAGTLTQAMLAARATGASVAAGGVALSASCGVFSVTQDVGSGAASVTNLSVTLTTTGRPVLIGLLPDTSGNYSSLSTGGGSGAALYLSIFQGSTLIGATVIQPEGTDAGDFAEIPASWFTIDAPAAGTYTYSIKASRGVSTAVISYARMIAFEL